jgi:hypothetical protein
LRIVTTAAGLAIVLAASFSSSEQLTLLVISVGLAFIPALVASRKGYSAPLFWVFGFLCFLPALIVSLVIRPKDNPYR